MISSETEQAIYTVLAAIPAGTVTSYGRVAELAGLPGAARLIGRVLKNLPQDSTLPWHRVIRADGRIAIPPESRACQRQTSRLKQEGVEIVNGRISFRRFGWPPSPRTGRDSCVATTRRTE